MKIYDSSLRKKVEFVPYVEGKVSMYVCGPTVYDNIHIGNARTFLSFDVIRRWFEALGYDVCFVQNLTDVDDKIIKRAAEQKSSARDVALQNTQAFIDVMHRFGIQDPDIRPRATEEIDAMISMIEDLIARGHAYVVNSDVYFAVRTDPEYGCVSGKIIDELMVGARVDADEQKRDPLDFALWKGAKPHEPTWDSPWGPGRPGWHTECAAMVHRYLGLPIDIHGGGSDLQFPHHENECAQARSAWGGSFARHWMHTGMLLVDGEKMSKSLGNFFTLKEVLDEYPADALRLLMLQTHYRSPLDFSFERLRGASSSLERISNTVRNLKWASEHASSDLISDSTCSAEASPAAEAARALSDEALKAHREFEACMNDDFNTAGAVGSLFNLVSSANTYLDNARGAFVASACTQTFDELVWGFGVLGIALDLKDTANELPSELCDLAASYGCYSGDDPAAAAEALLSFRARARAEKNWAVADAIRNELAALHLVIEDTAQGARVKLA